jgi:hypothetical protein
MSRFAIPAVFAFALPGCARADEAVSYQWHVSALFSKLGCNGGACRGAVKGQNGFRLSLFGADPAGDHERLLREFGGRRGARPLGLRPVRDRGPAALPAGALWAPPTSSASA